MTEALTTHTETSTPESSDIHSVAGLVSLALTQVNHRLRAASGELGIGTLSAYAMLGRRGPMRSGDLARLEGVAAPTMTRMMDVLVQRGLVERNPDPDDGRASLLDLTEAGRVEMARVRAERARRLEALLEPLSPDQLNQLREIVGTLIESTVLES